MKYIVYDDKFSEFKVFDNLIEAIHERSEWVESEKFLGNAEAEKDILVYLPLNVMEEK